MKLEQVFYGRDIGGYDIQGSSIPSGRLTGLAVSLCQSVGTPGFSSSTDDASPFLIQWCVDDFVLMACGQAGEPDSMGRGTLLFHVFFASLSDVKSSNVTAATLYEDGLFSGDCRKGDLQPVEYNPNAVTVPDSPCKLELPAVVLCKWADNMKLLALMGSSIVGTSWTTISWNQMKSFTAYGLSDTYEVQTLPTDINIYDVDGRLLRRVEKQIKYSPTTENIDSVNKKRETMHRASLLPVIGAVCLLIGTVAGYFFGRTCQNKKGEDAQGSFASEVEMRVRNELEKEYELKYRDMERSARETSSRLKAEIKTLEMRFESNKKQMVGVANPVFNEECRIENFSKRMMETVPQYKLAMITEAGHPRHKDGRMLFKSLREYVNFVNQHYPKPQKEDQR